MRFVIRPARPDELPALAEAMAAAYVENLLATGLSPEDAEAVADMGLRQQVLKAAELPDLLVIVTEDTERQQIAAGLAIYAVRALRAAHGLYTWTRTEYRGRATFTRSMFRHTEKLLAARGCNRVEFGVFETNPRALRLYGRIGYTTVSVSMRKWLVPQGS